MVGEPRLDRDRAAGRDGIADPDLVHGEVGRARAARRDEMQPRSGRHPLPCFGDLGPLPGDGLQIDPLRLVEAVVAGVSFIGAGTIFASRSGESVQGITTAASLLTVAAIGITVGFRYYLLALAITVLTLAVLTLLRALERRATRALEQERKE